jgi:hypothetical protein
MKWIKIKEGYYINIDSFFRVTIVKQFPSSDRYHILLENKYDSGRNESVGSFTYEEALEWTEENLCQSALDVTTCCPQN